MAQADAGMPAPVAAPAQETAPPQRGLGLAVALECGVCLLFALGAPAIGRAVWRQAQREKAYRHKLAEQDRALLASAHRLIAESEALLGESGGDDGSDASDGDEEDPP